MNTFIVTSTINNDERYRETIDTIASIRKYAPGSQILLIDNSNVPYKIDLDIDHLIPFEHNMFTSWVNAVHSKGIGEAYLLSEAFKYIRNNNITSTRFFKLSGRYKLAEGFDISVYDDPKFYGKYAFRINDWDVSTPTQQWQGSITVRYLETRLYSFCHTLLDEYDDLVKLMFAKMLTSYGQLMCNWEMNHCQFIPEDKVIEMKPIYVEGNNADNGVYRFE